MAFNRMTREQRRWFSAIRACLTRDLSKQAMAREVPSRGAPGLRALLQSHGSSFLCVRSRSWFSAHLFSFGNGATHWWLANPENGDVIGRTNEQAPADFNYRLGRRKFMRLGKGPGGISEVGGILLQRARARIERLFR